MGDARGACQSHGNLWWPRFEQLKREGKTVWFYTSEADGVTRAVRRAFKVVE